jgi:hypothetical protein
MRRQHHTLLTGWNGSFQSCCGNRGAPREAGKRHKRCLRLQGLPGELPVLTHADLTFRPGSIPRSAGTWAPRSAVRREASRAAYSGRHTEPARSLCAVGTAGPYRQATGIRPHAGRHPHQGQGEPQAILSFSLLTRVRIRTIFATKETHVPLYGTLRGKPCPARPSRLRRLLASLVPSSYSRVKRGIQAAGGDSVEAAGGTRPIGSLQASGALDAQGSAYGRGGSPRCPGATEPLSRASRPSNAPRAVLTTFHAATHSRSKRLLTPTAA